MVYTTPYIDRQQSYIESLYCQVQYQLTVVKTCELYQFSLLGHGMHTDSLMQLC